MKRNKETNSDYFKASLNLYCVASAQVVANVKYRDSKLTHLLKASLEGRCRLVMIANVNPSHVFFDDSHNTLKYANRAKNIKVGAKIRAIKLYQAISALGRLLESGHYYSFTTVGSTAIMDVNTVLMGQFAVVKFILVPINSSFCIVFFMFAVLMKYVPWYFI